MQRILRLTVLFGIGAGVLLSNTAQAQPISPIRYNEGPGIKLSDSLVFHPGVAVEGRYDSNVFLEDTLNSGVNELTGAGLLRVIGHLHLATSSPQRLAESEGKAAKPKVAFRLKGAASYREYFSDRPAVTNLRSVEIDAGFKLTLFPEGVFSAALYDDFIRSYPQFSGMGVSAPRNTNRGGVDFTIAPGGKRLTFVLGYAFNFDIFNSEKFSFADKMAHEVNLNIKWRLLPQNAIFLTVSQQFIDYYAGQGTSGINNNNSMPFRISLGFAGLFTNRVGVLARIGYGNGFYDASDSYSSVLGQLEFNFNLGPLAKIKVGYQHLFRDSMLTNYYEDEHIYASYDHMIIQRILLHLSASYQYRHYGGFDPATTGLPQDLANHLVAFNLSVDYKIRDWIYIGLGYDLNLRNLPSGVLPLGTSGGTYVNDFTRHQVYGKVGVSY